MGSVLTQNSLEDMVQSTGNAVYKERGSTDEYIQRERQGMGRQYYRNNPNCAYYN